MTTTDRIRQWGGSVLPVIAVGISEKPKQTRRRPQFNHDLFPPATDSEGIAGAGTGALSSVSSTPLPDPNPNTLPDPLPDPNFGRACT